MNKDSPSSRIREISVSPRGKIKVTAFDSGDSIDRILNWKRGNDILNLTSMNLTSGYPEYIIVENMISGFKYKVLFV